MSQNYTTVSERLGDLFADPDSIDMEKLSADLQSQGAAVVGYSPGIDGGKDQLIYSSEALDGALERCGMSLPEKVIESAVEVKKRGRPKIEKGEDAIAEMSE